MENRGLYSNSEISTGETQLQIMTSKFKCVVSYVGPVSNLKVWTRVSYPWHSSLLGKATEITAVEMGYLSSVRQGKDPYSWKTSNKMLTVEL